MSPAKVLPAAPAVVAVAAAVALGVAACSGGDEPDAASRSAGGSSTAAAASPSRGAGSGSDARRVSDIEDGADLAAVMTAAMRTAGTARLKLTAASGAANDTENGAEDGAEDGSGGITGQGSLRLGDDPALQLASTAGAQQVRLRLVGGSVYVGLGRQIMGKSWLRLDPGGRDPAAAAVAGLVSALQGTLDVERSVSGFDRATGLEKTGRRTLDGVPTQGFEVVLEGDALRGSLAEQLSGVATGAAPEVARAVYRINLDDEGRPKRVAVTVTPADATPGDGGATVTTDYSDWGSPVTINPPPADQVR